MRRWLQAIPQAHSKRHWARLACAALLGLGLVTPTATAAGADPLPSWNEGPAKQAILAFVKKVTDEGGRDFVRPAERIATFDNDGTLWAEQPLYFQFLFALDRVKALAPKHPEWKDKEPFASLLKGDVKRALAGGTPTSSPGAAWSSCAASPSESTVFHPSRSSAARASRSSSCAAGSPCS